MTVSKITYKRVLETLRRADFSTDILILPVPDYFAASKFSRAPRLRFYSSRYRDGTEFWASEEALEVHGWSVEP